MDGNKNSLKEKINQGIRLYENDKLDEFKKIFKQLKKKAEKKKIGFFFLGII